MPQLLIQPTTFPGFPITIVLFGTLFVIKDPAPINEFFPNFTPQIIVELAPIDAPSLTIVLIYFFVLIFDLGNFTFVNTTLGPQKTFF